MLLDAHKDLSAYLSTRASEDQAYSVCLVSLIGIACTQ